MIPFDQFMKETQSSPFDPQASQKFEGLLEQVKSKENHTKCTYHSQENIDFFCLNPLCKRNLVCTECLLEGIHENHDVKKIDKLSESWLEMMKTSEITLKYNKESLELLQRKYENYSQTIAKGVEQKKGDLAKAFDVLFDSLRKKQVTMFEFLEKIGKENNAKNSERLSRISETIKLCNDGLEKIAIGEGFYKMSILDLSSCFTKVQETLQKIESFDDLKKKAMNDFDMGTIKTNIDIWLNNLANLTEKIVPKVLYINEKEGEIYYENTLQKMPEFQQKNLLNMEEEAFENIKENGLKESYLTYGQNQNYDSSGRKNKYHDKYGNLLEIFKPELAQSKISGFKKSSYIQNEYKTPEKKRVGDDWGSEGKGEGGSKGFLYSLEKQKLRYVGSSKKLI